MTATEAPSRSTIEVLVRDAVFRQMGRQPPAQAAPVADGQQFRAAYACFAGEP